jgi:hypothetical protein
LVGFQDFSLDPKLAIPLYINLMNLTLKNSATPLIGILVVAYLSLGISGGPNYGGGGSITLTGQYAGTLRGELNSNAIGLFTLTVGVTGLSTGDFVLFTADQNGITYNGGIQAVADPTNKTITGLVHAIATRTSIVEDAVTVITTGVADGSLEAKVKAKSAFRKSLKGMATVRERAAADEFAGPEQKFTVKGILQTSF